MGNSMARLGGGSWSVLRSGSIDWVYALAVSGSDLYAGGYFTTAGGSAANSIAKWDGSSWAALGSEQGGAGSELRAVGGPQHEKGKRGACAGAGGSTSDERERRNGSDGGGG